MQRYINRLPRKLLLICCLGIACASCTEKSQILEQPPLDSTSDAVQISPTLEEKRGLTLLRTPSATVPQTQPFEEPERRIVWRDTFDNPQSGWHDQVDSNTTPSFNNNTRQEVNFTRYVSGGFQAAAHAFAVLDVNARYQLPTYPYVIDTEVAASRDGVGVIAMDFTGNPHQLETSSGLFLRYELMLSGNVSYGNPRNEQAVPVDTTDRYVPQRFTFYELIAGTTWRLPCRTEITPPFVRSATLSIFVDDQRVVLILRSSEDPTVGRVVCNRIPNRIKVQNGQIGVGAIYRDVVLPVESKPVLLYRQIVVSTIPSIPATSPLNLSPERGGSCNEMVPQLPITEYMFANFLDGTCVGPGPDAGAGMYTMVRYPDELNAALGSWRCGRDPENVMSLRWDGTHILAVFDSSETYQIVPFHEILPWEDQLSFALLRYPMPDQTAALRPGDFFGFGLDIDLRMRFQNQQFISSWAGPCQHTS